MLGEISAAMSSTGLTVAPNVGGLRQAFSTAHLSLSSLGSSPRQRVNTSMDRKVIYKKITDWFTEWQPWEQRDLLCGLTKRCTTSQLELIATTLEPLFHRDFLTSLWQQYPIGHLKQVNYPVVVKERKGLAVYARQFANDIVENAILATLTNNPPNTIDNGQSDEENDKANENCESAENGNSTGIDGFVAEEESVQKEQLIENDESIAKSVTEMLTTGNTEMDAQAPVISYTQLKSNLNNTLKEGGLLKFGKCDGSRKIHISRWLLKSLEVASQFTKEMDFSRASIQDNLGLLLKRRHASITNHKLAQLPMESYNYNCTGTSTIRRSSIFDGTQSKLRSGCVRRPSQVMDLNSPAYKMAKPSKRLLESKGISAHKKPVHKSTFEDQVNSIWQWITGWQEFETLNLLVEVAKLCDGHQLNYLSQCLIERLRERVNMNWLPDTLHVLIFSYLSEDDIDNCSKVCRRWRYLCCRKELWMIKSLEFGMDLGIPNILQLLKGKGTRDHTIDWRLAYREIQSITDAARHSIELAKQPESHAARTTKQLPAITDQTPDVEIISSCTGMTSNITCLKNVSEVLMEKLLPAVEPSPEVEMGPLRRSRVTRVTDKGDDIALDVRPELVQYLNILGKKSTIPPMQWSVETAHEARQRLRDNTTSPEPIKRVRKLQGHMDAVLTVAMDVRRLISGSMDRTVRIWDIRSGRSIHKLLGHKGGVSCLVFDNETLYTGSWDMSIMEWSLLTFHRIAVLTAHKGSISSLCMNDEYVFSGSHDCSVRVWCRSTATCHLVMTGHESHVTCIALRDTFIISGSTDRSIRITDFLNGTCLKTIKTSYAISTMCVTGSLIMTGNQRGELHVINIDTGKPEVAIRGHQDPITRIIFYQNHIFTTSIDSTIKEWDLMTMTCVRSLQGHKGGVNDIQVCKRRMVSAGVDGHIQVWDKTKFKLGTRANRDEVPIEVIHEGEDAETIQEIN